MVKKTAFTPISCFLLATLVALHFTPVSRWLGDMAEFWYQRSFEACELVSFVCCGLAGSFRWPCQMSVWQEKGYFLSISSVGSHKHTMQTWDQNQSSIENNWKIIPHIHWPGAPLCSWFRFLILDLGYWNWLRILIMDPDHRSQLQILA